MSRTSFSLFKFLLVGVFHTLSKFWSVEPMQSGRAAPHLSMSVLSHTVWCAFASHLSISGAPTWEQRFTSFLFPLGDFVLHPGQAGKGSGQPFYFV